MKRIALIALVVGFVFFGCDADNTDGDEFTASTNETVLNDVATLGLIGTSVSSSNTSVTTAEIVSAKIKITSVSEGTAVLTVSDASNHNATINVTVAKTGSITIGTIVKYNPFIGTWFSSVGSGVTLVCESSTWNITIAPPEANAGMKGGYTISGSTATFTITHVNDLSGNWVTVVPAGTESMYGITSLPQTFTGTISGTQLVTTSGAGTFNAVP